MIIPKAKRINLEVTNICNFSCDFCSSRISKRAKKNMEFSLFKKAVDEIAREKLADEIALHELGEPLLYPQILEALKYVKSSGFKIHLTTNGSLLDERMTNGILDSRADLICVSFPLSEEEKKARSNSFSFDEYYQKIMRAVEIVNERRARTKIKLRVLNHCTEGLFGIRGSKEIRRDFRKNLVSLLLDLAKISRINVSPEEIERRLRKIGTNQIKSIWLNDWVGVEIRLFGDWKRAFDEKKIPTSIGSCSLAFFIPGVLSSGEVIICCADYDSGTSLGNLHSNSLVELLHSEKAIKIANGFRRFKVVNPYCQKCLGGYRNRFEASLRGILAGLIGPIFVNPNLSLNINLFD